MIPVGIENTNHFADEGQQQINSQSANSQLELMEFSSRELLHVRTW
jgi:hypothetical protein